MSARLASQLAAPTNAPQRWNVPPAGSVVHGRTSHNSELRMLQVRSTKCVANSRRHMVAAGLRPLLLSIFIGRKKGGFQLIVEVVKLRPELSLLFPLLFGKFNLTAVASSPDRFPLECVLARQRTHGAPRRARLRRLRLGTIHSSVVDSIKGIGLGNTKIFVMFDQARALDRFVGSSSLSLIVTVLR